MTRRRDLLKACGAVGAVGATAGCLRMLPWRGDDDSSGEDSGGDADAPSGEAPKDNGAVECNCSEYSEENSSADETESEGDLEAATPDTDPSNAPNESEYADPAQANESQPTVGDIAKEKGELKTDESGATATGTLTNNHDDVISVIEVEVTFLEKGQAVTTNMWGTNNLAPGEQWNFEVRAEGSEYSTVDDFEIAVLL